MYIYNVKFGQNPLCSLGGKMSWSLPYINSMLNGDTLGVVNFYPRDKI